MGFLPYGTAIAERERKLPLRARLGVVDCGGLCRRPPRPPRVRAGPAGVLSEAGRCCRVTGPGCWAVGGAGKIPSRRKPDRGLLPPYEPPGTATAGGAGRGRG